MAADPEPGNSGGAVGTQKRYKLPSANPLPLSAQQEARVRDRYYANVRKICDDEIRAFAECASGRTFSMTWKCRTEKNAMKDCMIKHATPEEQDRAREEWFHEKMGKLKEQKRLQEEEDKKKEQQEAATKKR